MRKIKLNLNKLAYIKPKQNKQGRLKSNEQKTSKQMLQRLIIALHK